MRGLEEIVQNSIPKQEFIDVSKGSSRQLYTHTTNTTTGWLTGPLKTRTGRTRILSGDALVYGNLSNMVKSLNRAVRIPALVKRYVSRTYRAIHKCGAADAIFGSDKPVVSEISADMYLPSQFLNTIHQPSGIQALEVNVLNAIEGQETEISLESNSTAFS